MRIPVIWGPAHRQHAKLYYTLQALRRPDLHAKVFDAIHRTAMLSPRETKWKRAPCNSPFWSRHGVTEKDFNAAYDSMTVAVNMQRAEELTKSYAIAQRADR